MTALKIVHGKEKKKNDGTPSVKVVEMPDMSGPSGNYKIRRNKHTRHAQPCEIRRLIERFLRKFYMELAVRGLQYEALSVYNISELIGDKLSVWLGRISGREEYYVPPQRLVNILSRMEIGGCQFDVQPIGYKDIIVRLMEEGETRMRPTVHLKTQGGRSQFSK